MFVKTVSWSLVMELQGSGERANCSSEATSRGKLWTQGGTRRNGATAAVWSSSTREEVVTGWGEGHIASHFKSYHVCTMREMRGVMPSMFTLWQLTTNWVWSWQVHAWPVLDTTLFVPWPGAWSAKYLDNKFSQKIVLPCVNSPYSCYIASDIQILKHFPCTMAQAVAVSWHDCIQISDSRTQVLPAT